MDEAALARLHARLDLMLQDLSMVSQRIARVEVQETKIGENARDIKRLEERFEVYGDRFSRLEAMQYKTMAQPSMVPKSRSKDYIEKGGLVISGGVVVEMLRQIVDILKN